MSDTTIHTTPAGITLVGNQAVYSHIKSLTLPVVEAINEANPGYTVKSTDESTGEYIWIEGDVPASIEFYIANPVEEHNSAWTWICFDPESPVGEVGTDAPAYNADPSIVAEWFIKTIRENYKTNADA